MRDCRAALKAAFFSAAIFFSSILNGGGLFANSQIIFTNPASLGTGAADISERWDYFKSDFVPPEDFYPEPKNFGGRVVRLPHFFEEGAGGCASYHIRLTGLIPNERYVSDFYGAVLSSCRIWCNGKIVATGGSLSKDITFARPGEIYSPAVFQADKDGVIDIMIHAANFESGRGGIAKRLKISTDARLRQVRNLHYFFNALVFAFLTANIIYNLILSLINFKQSSRAVQIILSLLYIGTVLFTGHSLSQERLFDIPYWLHRRLPLVLLALETAAASLYTEKLYKVPFKKTALIFFPALLCAALALALRGTLYEAAKLPIACATLLAAAADVSFPVRFTMKKSGEKKPGARRTLRFHTLRSTVSLATLFCCANDFLIVPQRAGDLHPFIAFKAAILLFGISQCGVYAFNRAISGERVRRHAERLSKMNDSLSKIVPEQILKLLGAADITKIIPGESRIIEALIFYVEVKRFNQLSETIEKKELYSILRDFFQAVSPVIIESGGFVAKYEQNGCLAIFQQRNSAAIICASRIQAKLKELRRNLRKTNRSDISVGISIHSGKVAAGTLGTNFRLDTAAISDDVNVTVAVARQASKSNAQILITEEAMPYCRPYINYVYEGHLFLRNESHVLVYSALPIKKSEEAFEDTLEAVEEEDEL